jgi:hypothetical protein
VCVCVCVCVCIDLESGHLFRYGEYAAGFTIVDSGFSSLHGRDFSTPQHSDLLWMPHGLIPTFFGSKAEVA